MFVLKIISLVPLGIINLIYALSVYQNFPLSNFTQALHRTEDERREWIEAIVKCMENRFKDLKEAPVYKHPCPILDM